METIKGSVTFRLKKVKYVIAYEINDGLILLDKSEGFSDEVYRKAYDKVSKEQQETIDKMLEESYQNEEDEVPEKEKESKIEKVTQLEKVPSINKVTEIKKVTKTENDTLSEKDVQIELYEKRIKELEEELKRKKGGRPAIGETRKVSLTLPTWLWEDIDRTVLVAGIKQSAFLRDLTLEGYHQHTLALNKRRGLVRDEL